MKERLRHRVNKMDWFLLGVYTTILFVLVLIYLMF